MRKEEVARNRLQAFESGAVTSIAVAPHGASQVVAASWNGEVTSWNLAEGTKLWSVTVLPRGMLEIAAMPDGRLLACGGGSGEIVVLSLGTGKTEARRAEGAPIITLAACRSGSRVLVGRDGGVIELWSTDKWRREWHYAVAGSVVRVHEFQGGAIARVGDRVLVLDAKGRLISTTGATLESTLLAPFGQHLLLGAQRNGSQLELRSSQGELLRTWRSPGVRLVEWIGGGRWVIGSWRNERGSVRIVDRHWRCVAKSPFRARLPVFAVARWRNSLIEGGYEGLLTVWTPRDPRKVFGAEGTSDPDCV